MDLQVAQSFGYIAEAFWSSSNQLSYIVCCCFYFSLIFIQSFTTKETNVVLKNLVPYTNYIIDVQAKLNKSIYWSDKSTYKTRTLSSGL